ncbi:MAG: hypothetical protein U0X93_13855 [Anaerolineales bacterium]
MRRRRFGSAPFIASATAAPINPTMAAGVSCGTPIMPGQGCGERDDNSHGERAEEHEPDPAGQELAEVAEISAASEISMLMVTMAAINPAVMLGSRIWAEFCRNSVEGLCCCLQCVRKLKWKRGFREYSMTMTGFATNCGGV